MPGDPNPGRFQTRHHSLCPPQQNLPHTLCLRSVLPFLQQGNSGEQRDKGFIWEGENKSGTTPLPPLPAPVGITLGFAQGE